MLLPHRPQPLFRHYIRGRQVRQFLWACPWAHTAQHCHHVNARACTSPAFTPHSGTSHRQRLWSTNLPEFPSDFVQVFLEPLVSGVIIGKVLQQCNQRLHHLHLPAGMHEEKAVMQEDYRPHSIAPSEQRAGQLSVPHGSRQCWPPPAGEQWLTTGLLLHLGNCRLELEETLKRMAGRLSCDCHPVVA